MLAGQVVPAMLLPAPTAVAEPDGLDVCRSAVFPSRPAGLEDAESTGPMFVAVLEPTPVPGLGAGLGAMPRFRAEPGSFIGLAGTMDLRTDSASSSPFAPGLNPGDGLQWVGFKSTQYDLPVREYRPCRSFAGNQSSTVLFQLFTAADVPSGASVIHPPGAAPPTLETVWSVGLRMVFDWRYYR